MKIGLTKCLIFVLKIRELGLNHLISILIGLPLGCEWIPLLMVEVLLQVEEGVKEDRRHLALLQVLQRDGVLVQRPDHVQHLKGEGEEVVEEDLARVDLK